MEQPYTGICFFTTLEQRINLALSYKHSFNLYCAPVLAVCALYAGERITHSAHSEYCLYCMNLVLLSIYQRQVPGFLCPGLAQQIILT